MSNRIVESCSGMLEPGDCIVVAVSGGADSMCLASGIAKVRKDINVVIAHVNHQLRGTSAEEDAQFVCAWAQSQGLPRAVVRINLSKNQGSLQSSARHARYQALLQVCRRFGANKLATAHHADDQVETFLLNLLRGSGSKGLQGIPRQRQLADDVTVVRPLLDITRSEIERYCLENNISWRQDSSNDSLRYQRNRIRHQLIPLLKTYNSSFEQVILNTMSTLIADQQVLDLLTKKSLADVEVKSPLPFAPRAVSLDKFQQLPEAMQNRVIQGLLPAGAEFRHIKEVLDLVAAPTGSSVDLPGDCRAYRLHDSMAIGGHPPEQGLPELIVSLPGQGQLGQLNLTVTVELGDGEGQAFWLPQDIKEISIGPRRPGDYFYPSGGGKKLKDYLIDRKVPRWNRDFYPVIRAGGEIIWVVGLARDTRYISEGLGKRKVSINIE